MKKNILLIIIIFTFLTNLIYAYNSKDAEGFWLMPAKPKGRMEVVKIIVINNNLYAYAVKLHDDVKNDFLNLVDNNGGVKMNGVGRIFEQIIAQDMKSNLYSFAYSYKKKPVESELEFILIDDYSAIEVKSGGFEDYPSSLEYAETGKKVFFLTMLPYLGEYKTNFILLPIYALCFLNHKELLSVTFKEAGSRAKELLLNGKLPNTKGFC